MVPTREQRRELGAFLRARRDALLPSDAGVMPGTRRRTPGLRREEVALLCGISTAWYTFAEQGRDIALSAEALARLAAALHLTTAERAYVFDLARRRDPSAPAGRADEPAIPASLARALDGITAPAYVLDRLWHVRAWNDAAADLFAGWFGGGERCLPRYVFLDPAARDFIVDWEERAGRLVAEFRADTAPDAEEPGIRRLVAGLSAASADFARLWNRHAVLGRDGGARLFRHARRGLLRYEQTTLLPASDRHCKLVLLIPA